MRKIILLFVFTAVVSMPSFATHLMGGEIIATQLHDSTYQVKLTTYRDTLGIPMATIVTFKVRDTSGAVIMTFNTPQDAATSGVLLPLYPYGVEVYYFIDTIVLPGAGTYHISFENCCRNGAIMNMSTPLNENMFLTTTVTYFPLASNSTPFFLVRPVIFLPVNTPWNYNPLPFDSDGDSLVYRLDTPYTSYMTNVAGFITPSAATAGPFTIDPVTSTISWTANNIGNFDATVLTEEYRNGVKIGEIRRDMQFIVVAPTSSIPEFTNMNQLPVNQKGNYHVGLLAEEFYEFSFFAEDRDTGDVVLIEAFGEPFLMATSKAKFSLVKTGKTYGNEVKGTFTWIPDLSHARYKPYLVVYRVSDGIFANDQTVMYNVYSGSVPPTGIAATAEETHSIGEIYPNPAQSLIHIPMKFSREINLNISIYNANGVNVMDMGNRMMNAGNHVSSANIDLSNGLYIVVFKDGDQFVGSQQLTVLR